MSLFLVVFAIMLLLVAAMSVGVIFGRPPIAGTCGGLNNMTGGAGCDICGGDPKRCDASSDAPQDDRAADAPLARDAMRR
ncbi:MAG TPA: (Na+)-NQR maturation NqrM [Pseudomonadales bacterium]|nr:(Na+)-NQR maturation NqrM [Pseudomonadales bacterium]